jgi:uncharacterized HhH-GPD family protein
VELHLSQDPEADALLSTDAFALLVGMVLDQQVPLEWAFAAPAELRRRLGTPLDPKRIAAMDPEALAAVFSAKPALHRYPGSMASRVHELSRIVSEQYRGRAEKVWAGADTGAELLRRIKELPGFGEQKAKIFVALLGKQLGVRPDGWEDASAPFGDRGSFRSVADITGPDTLAKVRAFKAELKAAHKREQATSTGKAPTTAAKTSSPARGKKATTAPRKTGVAARAGATAAPGATAAGKKKAAGTPTRAGTR